MYMVMHAIANGTLGYPLLTGSWLFARQLLAHSHTIFRSANGAPRADLAFCSSKVPAGPGGADYLARWYITLFIIVTFHGGPRASAAPEKFVSSRPTTTMRVHTQTPEMYTLFFYIPEVNVYRANFPRDLPIRIFASVKLAFFHKQFFSAFSISSHRHERWKLGTSLKRNQKVTSRPVYKCVCVCVSVRALACVCVCVCQLYGKCFSLGWNIFTDFWKNISRQYAGTINRCAVYWRLS